MTIKRHANLHKLIDPEGNIKIEKGGMDLKSKDYCLLSGDLRDWSAVSQRLIESGLDLGYNYIHIRCHHHALFILFMQCSNAFYI